MCNCGKSKAKRRIRPKSRLIKGSNVVASQPPEEKRPMADAQPVTTETPTQGKP